MGKDRFWAGMFIGGVLGVAMVFLSKKMFAEEAALKEASELLAQGQKGQEKQEKDQPGDKEKNKDEKKDENKKNEKKQEEDTNEEEKTKEVRNSESERKKKGKIEEQGLGEAISGKINFKEKLNQLEETLQKLRKEKQNRG